MNDEVGAQVFTGVTKDVKIDLDGGSNTVEITNAGLRGKLGVQGGDDGNTLELNDADVGEASTSRTATAQTN